MKKYDFCGNWQFTPEGRGAIAITLPHDAQITEQRSQDASDSGHGYFPGSVYRYEKKFTVPEDWRGKTVLVEFEGIYRNAEVSLNGKKLCFHPYGYTNFTVELAGLKYGGENTLTVVADNSKLPNSRWYSGGGIYRPVWLWVGKREHIAFQGVRVNTVSITPPAVRVRTEITGGEISVDILDGGTVIGSGEGCDCQISLPGVELWSAESPKLYTYRITLRSGGEMVDAVEETFGIRQIQWSNQGLFINGKETLLRGGCIHHDNGILGAATYRESEERRVRIMKENGFNAIRSAHNPASQALLDACDRYGMYVMDETFDMWYNRKTKFDYGADFPDWWERDTRAMVERDYNHPSVIMYSIGNEVAEPWEEKGVQAGKAMVDLIHAVDPSRPVTCGLNLMILSQAAKGQGIYQDGETHTQAQQDESRNTSLDFNIMAAAIGTGMNNGGNSPEVDALATPIINALDIAGYNYGSGRYPLEREQHPERLLVGSETFPQDICKNWAMVEKYPYLIGDFMWTAWDYLGEAGIGAWSYTGGVPFNRPYPWLLSGAGVIDILGNPDGSCKYAATVWGLEKAPVIAVRPANHPGTEPTRSVWRGTNAILSWSWQGCEGNPTVVEVYAQAAEVELFLNGRSLGREEVKDCQALFHVEYAPGELRAVAYDDAENQLGESSLHSAVGEVSITVTPEVSAATPGEIVYIPVSLAGTNGIIESNADRELTVTVENSELLAFGSANPCIEEQYHTGSFTTYYGRALAVVRAPKSGVIKVTVTDGAQHISAEIPVK